MSPVFRRQDSLIELLETRRLLAHYGLDPSFGDSGVASQNGGRLDLQLDGSILIANDSTLSRLSADGTLDALYNAPDQAIPFGVEDLPVFAASHLFNVRRGDTNGEVEVDAVDLTTAKIDKSFGTNGTADTIINFTFPSGDSLVGLPAPAAYLATPDGGVVVAEDCAFDSTGTDSSEMVLIKFTAAGQFDNLFGQHGQAIVEPRKANGDAVLAIDGNGKILVAFDNVTMPEEGVVSWHLSRFTSTGSIDTTFGMNGTVSIPPSGTSFDTVNTIVVQPDGKIAIGGESDETISEAIHEQPRLIRLNANGTADTTFGTGGEVTLPHDSDTDTQVNDLAVDSANRLLVVENFIESGADHLFRLTSSGDPDTSFASNGFIAVDQFATHVGDLTVDSQDRILADTDNQTVVRLTSLVPLSLGTDGVITFQGSDSDDRITVATSGQNVSATINGQSMSFAKTSVTGVMVNADDGKNTITISVDVPATVIAGSGDDTITSGSGADSISAGDGNNSIDAGDGDNTITAGSGDDSVLTGSGADSINTNDGNDTIVSTAGPDAINAGLGDDSITLGDGDNQVALEDGNDTLTAGTGDNLVDGSGGNVRINITGGNNSIYVGVGHSQITIGGSGANRITAEQGANQITTGAGNDTINCFGSDTVTAGAGDDLIIHDYDRTDLNASFNGGAGNDTIRGGDSNNTILGGDGNDSIRTGDGNDSLYGGAGSDTIYAGFGNDLLSGGGGRDHLFGQQGKDRLYGGNGDDILNGGPGNDRLNGGLGSDYLAAGPGDDMLTANDGERDSVYGGDGTDAASTDPSIDVLRSIEQ